MLSLPLRQCPINQVLGPSNKKVSKTYKTHSGGTETKVKEIVSDIPPHTNQNIGIG